jgi:hypothetical protein
VDRHVVFVGAVVVRLGAYPSLRPLVGVSATKHTAVTRCHAVLAPDDHVTKTDPSTDRQNRSVSRAGMIAGGGGVYLMADTVFEVNLPLKRRERKRTASPTTSCHEVSG